MKRQYTGPPSGGGGPGGGPGGGAGAGPGGAPPPAPGPGGGAPLPGGAPRSGVVAGPRSGVRVASGLRLARVDVGVPVRARPVATSRASRTAVVTTLPAVVSAIALSMVLASLRSTGDLPEVIPSDAALAARAVSPVLFLIVCTLSLSSSTPLYESV